jgi:hypothetical protein
MYKTLTVSKIKLQMNRRILHAFSVEMDASVEGVETVF